MSTKDDGGPAFPHQWTPGEYASGGMTLRDYFAAKAMPAVLAEVFSSDAMADEPIEKTQRFVADMAYMMADAMLEARKS